MNNKQERTFVKASADTAVGQDRYPVQKAMKGSLRLPESLCMGCKTPLRSQLKVLVCILRQGSYGRGCLSQKSDFAYCACLYDCT